MEFCSWFAEMKNLYLGSKRIPWTNKRERTRGAISTPERRGPDQRGEVGQESGCQGKEWGVSPEGDKGGTVSVAEVPFPFQGG
jgi:hypothetical protein